MSTSTIYLLNNSLIIKSQLIFLYTGSKQPLQFKDVYFGALFYGHIIAILCLIASTDFNKDELLKIAQFVGVISLLAVVISTVSIIIMIDWARCLVEIFLVVASSFGCFVSVAIFFVIFTFFGDIITASCASGIFSFLYSLVNGSCSFLCNNWNNHFTATTLEIALTGMFPLI